ncbi:MAG: hypothetical protein EHM47_05170 [Ignavibacteriales bacterium]|nr:MAG: hypothetical protein EHM47_05170 [Ignavibacteriales bacterium]
MKTLFLLIVSAVLGFGQSYRIDKITGNVKFLNSNDEWIKIESGIELPANSIIITEKNSSAKISGEGSSINLKEESALLVSSIKQMTLDELLLALAMEDIMNAPRKKENNNGNTTAVYGTKEGAVEKVLLSDDFGIKRIKGAKQLAENGFKESAVVTSKDIFRKHPITKLNAGYRIYFADLLYDFGLYEEAYKEYSSIKELTLSQTEKAIVDEKISLLNKKLINN